MGFINLGSFKQVVFKHDDTQYITITLNARIQGVSSTYQIKLGAKNGEFYIELGRPYAIKLNLPINFPYPLNSNAQQQIKINEITYSITWNGITAQVTSDITNERSNKESTKIVETINKVSELVRSIDIVPLKRGFTKPFYGVLNYGQFPMNEDEVASQLAKDEYLDSKVSTYLEQIMDRQFRTKMQPGATIVNLTTTEKESKQTNDIVNDGFGVNQLVYLLAKVLNKDSKTICIEEPEINLHPGIIRRLPKVLIELAKEENKKILISTHSEPLVIAILAAIAVKDVRSEDIGFYLGTRQNGISEFRKQTITKDGQVEGGLTSFMEGELEDVKTFFEENKKEAEPIIAEDEKEDDINKQLPVEPQIQG